MSAPDPAELDAARKALHDSRRPPRDHKPSTLKVSARHTQHAQPSTLLIGLIGRKRAGKDTFASGLVESCGYTRLAFADDLKAAALEIDPYVPVGPEGRAERLSELVADYQWEAAKTHPPVREFLQRLGVAFRDRHDDVWLRPVLEHASALLGQGTPVVITDVRFQNEADAIRAAGGLLIRIERPDLPDDGDGHVSEHDLDGYATSLTVVNDGTPADLRAAAVALLRAD